MIGLTYVQIEARDALEEMANDILLSGTPKTIGATEAENILEVIDALRTVSRDMMKILNAAHLVISAVSDIEAI